MFIGEVSKRTGATVKAIRHYESIGLLSGVRRVGKYRVFTEKDVVLIRLVRQAQSLGFKLSEMKRIREKGAGLPTWRGILGLIEEKQAAVSAEIDRLEQQRAQLRKYHRDITLCLESNPDCEVS